MTAKTEQRIVGPVSFVIGVLIMLAALTAAAQDAPTPETENTARALYDAVARGHWLLAAAISLVLLVTTARWTAPKFLPDDASWRGRLRRWVASGEGAVTLALAGSVASGVVAALSAKIPFGIEWIETVVKVSFAGVGAHATFAHTLSGKAKEERLERREITGALAAGAVPAPPLDKTDAKP